MVQYPSASRRAGKSLVAQLAGSMTALLALLICVFAFVPAARAQEFRGTISGAVTDPTGAVIPNASVQVKNDATGAVSKTTSDAAGQYVVPFLLPGEYTITATAKGFQTLTRNGVTLSASEHPIVNLAMKIGNEQQTITVTEAAPQLDLANASVSTTISTNSVADLPLNGRTPATLVELSAGVISTAAPEQVHPFDNNAGNSWSIGGTPNQVSETLLDGSPNETLLGALAFSPSEDTVQEVSVQPFATDASFGHTIGGVMNQVTKSGTNQFHGTAYEFGQISGIDANTYFNDRNNKPTPTFHYNQYGLTFGGPVWLPKVYNGRNKTFFFFAWEGLKDSTPNTATMTVPTISSVAGSPGTGGEANGDFYQILQADCPNGIASNTPATGAMCAPDSKHSSAYSDPGQLWDPRSSTLVGKNIVRTPIYNNQLQSVYPTLDSVALAYMKLFPGPNAAGAPDGENNYISNAPSIDTYDNEFGRLDFNVGANDHLFLDVRHNDRAQVKNNYFANNATGTTLTRENWGTTLDNVFTVNPTTVLDVRLNWMLFYEAHGSPADAFTPQSVGLPSSLATNSTQVQLPYINFQGLSKNCTSYQCLGDNTSSIDPGSSYQIFVDMIKTLGRHTLKVGFDGRQYRLSVTNYGNSVGTFGFNDTWTNAGSNGATGIKGPDLAAFLLGVPASGQYDLNARGDYHQNYVGVFAQDDFRVSNKLTLNLGLRFDINTPYEERLGRTVDGFNPAAAINYTSQPVYSSTTTQPNPNPDGSSFTVPNININGGLTFPSGKNGAAFATNSGFFSPRFGFSYALTPKTVVRGGFGIFVMPETMSNMAATGVTSSNALSNQEGYSATTQYITSTDGVHVTGNMDQPYSALTQPAGSSQGANTFLGQSITFLAPVQHDPYSERWDVGVQRSLTNNLMVEALYVGNHGVHLPVGQQNINAMERQYLSTTPYFNWDMNNAYGQKFSNPFQGTMGPDNTTGTNTSSTTSFGSLTVPFPQFGSNSINEQNETIGQSWFDSGILHVEHRSSRGLTLTANYSFSKMMEADSYLNDQDTSLEHRVSPFDHTHHFTVGGVYDLPFGRGKTFNMGNSKLWDEVAGGWVINSIYQFQSGAPIYFSNDLFLDPNTTSLRQITIQSRNTSNISPQVSKAPGAQALNTAAFETTSAPKTCSGTCNGSVDIGGQPFDHYRTLPTTLSWVRQDGYNNLDASILKNFNFTEGRYFQLRFETFNTLNHPTFDPPAVSSGNSSTFGVITATTKNSLPRQIQIGGRLVF